MVITYSVVAVIAAFMLAMSARLKLVRDEKAVTMIGDTVGVPLRFFPLLATLEIAGAVGLLVGIAVAPLGIAAGIGLVAYFLVATASHVRVGDRAGMPAALIRLVVAVAALVLRVAA
jgi:hypothetical protein